MVVVYLAWAYVEQRFDRERSSRIQTYGDIIRRHREEHAVEWLTGAVTAIETGDVDLVLQYFLLTYLPRVQFRRYQNHADAQAGLPSTWVMPCRTFSSVNWLLNKM